MYIQVNKANISQQIAENIENMILGREIQIGERLPGEMELADTFGASRNVVREALTMLKERGLVEVRNGSGAYVTKIQPQTLGDVVTRMTAVGAVTPQEVYEFRMALEVRSCGLAAQNGTRDEKEALRHLIQEMERQYNDMDAWYALDGEFHLSLAKMSHNSLFPVMIEPLIPLLFPKNAPSFVPPSLQAVKGGIEQHKGIVTAVLGGERSHAEKAMAQHLQHSLDDMTNSKK